ncbi:MAG: hypothetical protein LAP13_25415 [Acidobacteriia bacterium]|nr:hypothetical protein [Terriglobia bacterium]
MLEDGASALWLANLNYEEAAAISYVGTTALAFFRRAKSQNGDKVLITLRCRNVAVPLSQLTPLNADESTAEAIGDWHYWVSEGYCF